MANQHKGFRGCNPNPDIVQKIPDTFTEFVLGFCEHQTDNRAVDCDKCFGDAVCTYAHIEHDRVLGTFACKRCGSKREMVVDMSVLKEMFDRLVEE